MRLRSTVVAVLWFSALAVNLVRGDDLKINTPVVSANLKGRWELQPEEEGKYKQTLHLGPQFSGEWRKSDDHDQISWTEPVLDLDFIGPGASTMNTLAILIVLFIAIIVANLPHRPHRGRHAKRLHVRF